MAFRAGSADEMAANADFQLLPEDEYLASVEEMEFVPKEDQQPSKFTPVPQDQYKAHLRIHSFADGADLEDTEGKPVAEFKIIQDRKSTRLNSSHLVISYAVFCLKKKNKK